MSLSSHLSRGATFQKMLLLSGKTKVFITCSDGSDDLITNLLFTPFLFFCRKQKEKSLYSV